MSGGHGGRRDGAGRPKGRVSDETALVKELVLGALQDVGGRDYLAARAIDTPTAFMGLLGKILPTQLTGPDGGPVMIVTGVDRDYHAEPDTNTAPGFHD